jgi:dihydroneopterin aldolase
VSAYGAEVLTQQLAQLGRDLDTEVKYLGQLDETAVEAEGEFRRLDEEHGDRVAEEFLKAEGAVETRKMIARLKAVPARLTAQDAWLEWNRAKSRLRTQQASIQALHRRVEIGRSMLSREKALISLAGVGET